MVMIGCTGSPLLVLDNSVSHVTEDAFRAKVWLACRSGNLRIAGVVEPTDLTSVVQHAGDRHGSAVHA